MSSHNGDEPSHSSWAAPEWRALRRRLRACTNPLSLKAGFTKLALSLHFCTLHYSPFPAFVKQGFFLPDPGKISMALLEGQKKNHHFDRSALKQLRACWIIGSSGFSGPEVFLQGMTLSYMK